jgi:hypothetical protein
MAMVRVRGEVNGDVNAAVTRVEGLAEDEIEWDD